MPAWNSALTFRGGCVEKNALSSAGLLRILIVTLSNQPSTGTSKPVGFKALDIETFKGRCRNLAVKDTKKKMEPADQALSGGHLGVSLVHPFEDSNIYYI